MAHFRATISGGRGDASRLGTKASGIRATAGGWNLGGALHVNHRAGQDTVSASITGGSNGPVLLVDLGEWRQDGAVAACVDPPSSGPLAQLIQAATAALPDLQVAANHQAAAGYNGAAGATDARLDNLRAALAACGVSLPAED